MRFAQVGRARLAAFVTLLVAIAVAAVFALQAIDREASGYAYRQARAKAGDDAALLAAGLQAELDKFSLVPLVLAADSEVQGALSGGPGRAVALNRRFEALARQTNAAAIYLMDPKGMTIAASNWRLPTSFVGSNYSFRRYYGEALARGSATQFALGTVSRKPGLYIAQRVERGDHVLGIVAVKVEFGPLEAKWRAAGAEVFVTDRDGVVLITSREPWRFHTTRGQSSARRNRVLDQRQFGIADLPPLILSAAAAGRAVGVSLLDADQPIAFGGWHLHLLLDTTGQVDAAITRARFYVLLALLAAGGFAALALFLKRRRDARAQGLVERKTQELREQLGQANRLAILGQVTAGIGHEINQPLAAVQVFAENGAALLDGGDIREARANFAQIVALAERIGRITTELRGFARRGSADAEIFPVGRAIDGALMLLHDRIVRSGVVLTLPDSQDVEMKVRAEPVRLEQVLVNLLQNALDATGAGGAIIIELKAFADHCLLKVTDNGPGLAGAHDRLFQPFATTKPDGLGLGLVISREIMRGLHGELSVESSKGGSCFVMKIPLA